MEVFKHWLETNKFLPHAQDAANIPEYPTYMLTQPTPEAIHALPFAIQHLETGYPQTFSKLKELEKQIKEHNKSTEEFISSLYRLIKEELGLPESTRNRRYAYYRRTISYTLRKTLTGYPETEPKIVVRIPDGFELNWGGASLVIGNKEDCEKGLKLIAKLRASHNIVEEAKNLHEKAKELNTEREKLKETLYLKVVSKIEVGGIIQGKCDACSREKTPLNRLTYLHISNRIARLYVSASCNVWRLCF
jgi:hypothetical protein